MIVDNNWATTAVNANFKTVEDALFPESAVERLHRRRTATEGLLADVPEVANLARRMAIEYGHDPDSLIYRGAPQIVMLPAGAYYRATTDHFPLWRAFVYPAHMALTIVDERKLT